MHLALHGTSASSRGPDCAMNVMSAVLVSVLHTLGLVAVAVAPDDRPPPAEDHSTTHHHASLGSSAVPVPTEIGHRSLDSLSANWTRAEWIGGETQLRRSFVYSSGVDATLFVSSLGCHELFLNGHRLGLAVLQPGFSTLYPARVLYTAHNISGLLNHGAENTIGVRLSSCKYGWQDTYCALGQRRCVAVKLELVANSAVVIHTEATSQQWLATQGPYALDGSRYPNRSLFDGVRYDQALDDQDWCLPSQGRDSAPWAPATKITPPWGSRSTHKLVPHLMPPITVHPPDGVAAVSLRSVGPNTFIADFGANIAGYVTIMVPPTELPTAGKSEVLVEVEHAEMLTARDGRVFNQFSSPPHSVEDCQHYGSCALQTDRYRLVDLSRGLTLSPGTSTYKGFRYVEIRGLPNITLNSLRAYVVHSDVEQSVSFHSNMTLLNQLNDAISSTVLSNLMSIPTDCPTREKRGWAGDAQWSAENNAARWNMSLFYRNWLTTILDTQVSSCSHASAKDPPPGHCLASNITSSAALLGSASEWRPACAICCDYAVTNEQRFGCYSENGTHAVNLSDPMGSIPGVIPFDLVSGWPADPGYSAVVVTVPYALWRRGGDMVTMAQSFDGIRAYADYLLRHLTGGMVQYGMLGDWLSLQPVDQGFGNSDVPRVSAFSGALSLQMAAEMADALNQTVDNQRFLAAVRVMRERYHAVFFEPDSQSYGNCSQIANTLPLVLGCVPTEKMRQVSAALVASLSQECTGLQEPTILTGGVGSRYIWEALVLINRTDLAMQLALKQTEPSLAWMITQGPGTYWEDWHGSSYGPVGDPRGSSKNHHMLTGGFGLFVLDVLGGLRATHDRSGSASLCIDLTRLPVLRTIGSASTSVKSSAGTAKLSWAFTEKLSAVNVLSASILVPANVGACVVRLPTRERTQQAELQVNGKAVRPYRDGVKDTQIQEAQMIPLVAKQNGILLVHVGVGRHEVTYTF